MAENEKNATLQTVLAEGGVSVTHGHEVEKRGSEFDQLDMVRMGKRQETRVRKRNVPCNQCLTYHVNSETLGS